MAALCATDEKANYQRLARLLMRGGHTLLREVFDSIHPPASLSATLHSLATVRQLQALRRRKVLTQPEWDCLYLPTGMGGKSADFDISLLFKLLRNFCSLTPPATGWDSLPNITDHSLEADLARIKYYRNFVHGHNQSMEISDADFDQLWSKISEALLRIAGSISTAKRDKWKKAIDKFLHDPLTPDAEQYVAELRLWCMKDMETKDEVEKLRNEVEQMNIKQEQMNAKQEQMFVNINIIVESIKANHSAISLAAGQPPNVPQVHDARLQSQSVSISIPSEQPQASGPIEPSSHRELQQNPLTALDFWHAVYSFKKSIEVFVRYLRIKLGVDVQGSRLGSLVITVSCSSMEVLLRLWTDYRSGHLNKVIQETLVTEEVLKELCLSEVKLKTIISDMEYKACKKFLKQKSGQTKHEKKKKKEISHPAVPTMVKSAALGQRKKKEKEKEIKEFPHPAYPPVPTMGEPFGLDPEAVAEEENTSWTELLSPDKARRSQYGLIGVPTDVMRADTIIRRQVTAGEAEPAAHGQRKKKEKEKEIKEFPHPAYPPVPTMGEPFGLDPEAVAEEENTSWTELLSPDKARRSQYGPIGVPTDVMRTDTIIRRQVTAGEAEPAAHGQRIKNEKEKKMKEVSHPAYYAEPTRVKPAELGYVMMINNYSFPQVPQYSGENRTSQRIQWARLKYLFYSEFGFVSREYINLTKSEMLNKLTHTAEKDFSSNDCFVCVIQSEGSKDGIFGSDDEVISLETITSLFTRDKCPSLDGKPKIFLIETLKSGPDSGPPPFPVISEDDFLIWYSPLFDESVLCDRTPLSFVVKSLEDYSSEEHLMDILMRVREEVESKLSCRRPYLVSALTKKVFFKSK